MEQGKNGSLIELAAAADSADGLQRAVGLLSLAIKGAFDGAGTAFQVRARIAIAFRVYIQAWGQQSDCRPVTAAVAS